MDWSFQSHGTPIECCVFDLAGTLFWSRDFETATRANAVVCIADQLSIDERAAADLLENRREGLSSEAGYRVALATAVTSFGIALDVWGSYQDDVDVPQVIRRDPVVRDMLEQLRDRYALVLYTNMYRPLALRVLEQLEVPSLWDLLITPEDVGIAKPSPAYVATLFRKLRVAPASVLSLGDRPEIDLVPFVSHGSAACLVRGRSDLLDALGLLGETGGEYAVV